MHDFRLWALAAFFFIGGCAATPGPGPGTAGDELAEINTQLGIGYLQEGDNETAMRRLQRALEIDRNYAPAHSAIAVLYQRLGETDKAAHHFERAVRLNPKDSGSLNNYGQFLCQQGRSAEAQAMFQRALENPLYPTPEAAYLNAGTCALRDQDTATAEEMFRRALQVNPRMPAALLQMSTLSYEQQRFLPARGYLQRYLEVGPHTAQSLWLGIRVERQLGDRDAVASYSLMLRRNFPDSPEAGWLTELQD